MRYFNNALGDRRVYIREINPYGNSHTPSIELRRRLIGGQTLIQAADGTTTAPIRPDSFAGAGSNIHEISALTAWTSAGGFPVGDSNSDSACLPRYSDLSPEMRAHIDKFGETPTYIGSDGKVHVDRAALTQRVADYYAGPEGGSMKLGGFSAERFANAGPERMSMLRDMRKENDADKAAKFEEDMRLAMERDAAKNNPACPAGPAGNNITAQIIGSLGTIAQLF
jgi:hypothetical protein